MNSRRGHPRDRVAKPNTGRPSRGSGRNSVSQNASSPTTSLKGLHGLYANQHFVHVASVAKGCTAELQVKSGKKFEGILTTVSPLGEVELRLAHSIDSSDSGVVPSPSQITEKMVFKAASIVSIDIKDVDMDYASKGADGFQTDGEIAGRKQNGQVTERELEAFETDTSLGEVSLGDDSLTSANGGWSAEDMFRKNEQMGVTSSYDSNLPEYTTPLELKDTDENQRRIQRADRLAKKIESSSDYNVRINKELECTEEDRFSAVVRPGGGPPLSSPSPSSSASSNTEGLNMSGKYIPPALRNKQAGEGLSSGGPPGHHRNHTPRATPPPSALGPLHPAGRVNRAQSPHHHMPPPQGPHLHHPPQGQRVLTPPHSHQPSTARSPQMPMNMPSAQQSAHMGSNPRSPTGISQPPLPQRIQSSGRRIPPEMSPQSGALARQPVQSSVPALAPLPATAADKQASVEKPRDGAGPQDVDKKNPEVPQPQQRVALPVDRSPRTSINDSSKKQTIEQFKEFKDNFLLQDKDKAGLASAATAATTSPQQQQMATTPATPSTQPAAPTTQDQQQAAKTSATAATPQSAATNQGAASKQSESLATPPQAAPSNVTSTGAVTPSSVTPSPTAASTTLVVKPADNPTSGDEKKESTEMIKKSTLNPNAKEFNPSAKPFVPAARMQPQKTPTPPRPPSQPSPAPQVGSLQAQYNQQLSQPLYHQIPIQQPNIHYPQLRSLGQRKGATNAPQMRGHGQPDIQHIVSMAAGPPLVAPAMLPFAAHQPGPGGPVSTAQPINHSPVLSHNQHMPFVYHQPQKQMAPRLAVQQNMVATGQPGGHGQHQISQEQVMVFPHMLPGLNTFPHSGNIPISQQAPSQMPTPYPHQFSQPQPQSHQHQHHQPHPQTPTVHLQPHPQPHPQAHQQHSTPPLAHAQQGPSHGGQGGHHGGQGQPQGGMMQQPQPHGGRPSPSPVNQVMHHANQQQQHQHPQQPQQFHPQSLQAMGQPQPQNHQMMAAMAAVNQPGGAGTGPGGSPHPQASHAQQQQQQQQHQQQQQQPGGMMPPQLHPHGPPHQILHTYPQAPHTVTNITSVTPVHTAPHPHPKPVFLPSTPGGHGGPGGGQNIQAIPMHTNPSILSSPVQGPYMQTPPGQMQQAQVQQYQPNN